MDYLTFNKYIILNNLLLYVTIILLDIKPLSLIYMYRLNIFGNNLSWLA